MAVQETQVGCQTQPLPACGNRPAEARVLSSGSLPWTDVACWYAVQTRSRHEKLVSREFDARGISHYLPLLERRRKWSDRYKTVAEPLFPCYLFVHVGHDRRIEVLGTRGTVRMVGAHNTPWRIEAAEIEAIRAAMTSKLKCDPYPYLKVGLRVHVTRGPLKGISGRLVEKNRKHRIVLSVDLIGRSIAVEVSAGDVEVL